MTSYEKQAVEIVQQIEIDTPYEAATLNPGCSGSHIVKVGEFVVRFWNMQWVDYFAQDLACALVASKAGYGPRIFYVDEAKGITVMAYHRPEALPEGEERLKGLVALLRKIHEGPLVPKGIDRALYLEQLLTEAAGNPNYHDLDQLKTIKDEVFQVTKKNTATLPCHRDLHPGNLIYTKGSLLAIDYTWGAMDDPYADLANVAIFHCKDINEERLLLKLYLEREATQAEEARLALMKLPAKMFYGLEFLWLYSQDPQEKLREHECGPRSYLNFGKHGEKTSPADFLRYGLTLLREVTEFAGSEEYKRALTCTR